MDKRTQSVPLDTDQGEKIVEQQNVGAGVALGGGEFPDPHTPPEAPAPGAAGDTPGATSNQTLTEVIGEFESDGFGSQFMPDDGGDIRCLTCDTRTPADQVDVAALRRIEGVSDPDDMAAIVALTCGHCSAKGTIALKYGPNATPEEADILRLLDRLNRSA